MSQAKGTVAMFLDTDFPPDARVENEAYRLVLAGYQVHLFSLCYKPFQISRETIKGIEVHRYPASKLMYKLSALAYTIPLFHWMLVPKVRQFLKNVMPDIIHIHDMVLPPSIFSLKPKVPVICDFHENRPEIMQFYPHMQKPINKVLIPYRAWKKMQVRLLNKAQRGIVVTEHARMQMEQLGVKTNHLTPLPNYIDRDIFLKYPIQDSIVSKWKDKFTLLYLGDTGLRRGTQTAIEALPYLIDEIPNIHLVLVGKSSQDHVLKAKIEELGLHSRVSMEGWQDVSLFPSYIQGASVGLSPLFRNPHHDTTYANKIFQYMAFGLPMVVSDCPAQADAVISSNTGLVHEEQDPRDLANKVLTLFHNQELAAQMHDNGIQAVQEKYNWAETEKHLLKVYEDLLPKK